MTTTDIKQQAGVLLSQVAGYIGVRCIEIGLKSGLVEALSKAPGGLTAPALAEAAGTDLFYTRIWCRSAYGAQVIEVVGDGADASEGYDPAARDFKPERELTFRLAPHMATLLLDSEHPAYLGGMPKVLSQPEIFDGFAQRLESGERIWWEDCGPDFIDAVSETGVPFYVRMIPAGFERIPGLHDTLAAGAAVTELCSGAGRGLARFSSAYPKCSLTGVDGDAYSLKVARERLGPDADLIVSALEEMELADQDMVFINISMHECRDIDEVAKRVHAGLKPGGRFVISDFPFPETIAGSRTVPGRIMSGIQFFEGLIGDQLMATSAFVDVLARNGFNDIASFDLTPVHAVTVGTR